MCNITIQQATDEIMAKLKKDKAMTDLPPETPWHVIEMLAEKDRTIADLRAELAALKPRETLEDVAKREARETSASAGEEVWYVEGFLRCHQMQKEGVLPDE